MLSRAPRFQKMTTHEHEKERLLGYLLNALDDHEAAQVKRDLSRQPRLRSELAMLQRELAPLNYITDPVEPPPQLADRTCAKIWATLDHEENHEEGEVKKDILDMDSPPTTDPVLGFIHDPFKTMVSIPAVELAVPTVMKNDQTSQANKPPVGYSKSSHRIGWVISISIGIVIAFFLFPMIRYAARSTQSYVTENWRSEINRRVDQYEQIHGNKSNVPRIEEMLPFNLALSGWQELLLDSQSTSTECFRPYMILAEGEPFPSTEIIGERNSSFLTDFDDWGGSIPLDISGMTDPILLSLPEQESSVRSAFGQGILLKKGRTFFRVLPGTEPPKN